MPYVVESRGAFRYELPTGATYQFRFENTGDHPIFIYALYFDPILRLRPVAIWDAGAPSSDGRLPPGKSADTRAFTQVGTNELEAFRFVVSEEPVQAFLHPPDAIMEQFNTSLPPGPALQVQTVWMVFR